MMTSKKKRQEWREEIGHRDTYTSKTGLLQVDSGAQLGKFERGRMYICMRKDEIIHGLSPSVKFVAPQVETCP